MTRDGGATWMVGTAPTLTYARSVSCPSAQVCAAIGSNKALVTTGGGTTRQARSSTGKGVTLSGVDCTTATICVVVRSVRHASAPGVPIHRNPHTATGGTKGSPTFVTAQDAGRTWTEHAAPTCMFEPAGISCPSAAKLRLSVSIRGTAMDFKT